MSEELIRRIEKFWGFWIRSSSENMNRDLAAFLCHTHSNLRASLPHHLQVQNQSESYVSNQVSRHQKVQNQYEQIVLFFSQIKSQGTRTPECLPGWNAQWQVRHGLVLFRRCSPWSQSTFTHKRYCAIQLSQKKTFRSYQLSTAPCACSWAALPLDM